MDGPFHVYDKPLVRFNNNKKCRKRCWKFCLLDYGVRPFELQEYGENLNCHLLLLGGLKRNDDRKQINGIGKEQRQRLGKDRRIGMREIFSMKQGSKRG
jgi:hypothetical protein